MTFHLLSKLVMWSVVFDPLELDDVVVVVVVVVIMSNG